jgi:transposase
MAPLVPSSVGPWQTAYERLIRWSTDGTWAKLLAWAQADVDAAGELDWLVAVDSLIVRIHQREVSARRVGGHAATAPAAARQAAAADARSAGG